MKLGLYLQLKSDATFGRGDGVAGLVDAEVEYDAATGLPFVRGRMLKGLLAEECANILFALSQQTPPRQNLFVDAAQFLFGKPGSTLEDDALMSVGAAMLPVALRDAVEADVKAKRLQPAGVLDSLTAIRRQTAVNEETGAPETGSLRSLRVALRETVFTAAVEIADKDYAGNQQPNALPLFAACVMSLRRGGTGRNRGRGRLKAWLNNESYTATQYAIFKTLVMEGVQ